MAPPKYAAQTSVPVPRSRAELEMLLERFGADAFAYSALAARGGREGTETVGFDHHGHRVRIGLAFPPLNEFPSDSALQKERRRRWRVLVLVVKSLLVGVEEGVIAFEEAFLPWFVMPDGLTIAEKVVPKLEDAVRRGALPALLDGRDGR